MAFIDIFFLLLPCESVLLQLQGADPGVLAVWGVRCFFFILMVNLELCVQPVGGLYMSQTA